MGKDGKKVKTSSWVDLVDSGGNDVCKENGKLDDLEEDLDAFSELVAGVAFRFNRFSGSFTLRMELH